MDKRLSKRGRSSHLEFSADSAEQIAESIDRTGLRGKLERAFAAAIARIRQHRDKSCEPPINEAEDVDS